MNTKKRGFWSVDVRLPKPKRHKSRGNLQGEPIVSIEIMHGYHADGKEDLVYWSHGREESEAFASLGELCAEYGLDLGEIIRLVSIAFVNQADPKNKNDIGC